MDSLDHYAEHSMFTDPGGYAGLLRELPSDISGLCKVVQGLVIHYRLGHFFDYEIPEDRIPEIDTRYASQMLKRITELEDAPITERRPPEKRIVGCCRDFTLLFCTMARHIGMPVRARVGFADYFVEGFNVDHEIAEVWNEGRWRLVDPQIAETPSVGEIFDATDVPRNRFLTGNLAWQMCRTKRVDPETFLVDPELEIEATRGWPYVRHNLVHDLAAVNRIEMILWDSWGLIEKEPSQEELLLLDEVAELMQADDNALPKLRDVYKRNPGLKVPSLVRSYSPATGFAEVSLKPQV